MKAAYAYGQYLGNRYKGFANVAWLNGNDFNHWTIPEDDRLVQAVSKGIRSVAPNQLQTVELHVRTSSSFDDPRWIPLIELNSVHVRRRFCHQIDRGSGFREGDDFAQRFFAGE